MASKEKEIMPTTDGAPQRGHWLQRRIHACRVVLGGLRRWGPLAWREMVDDSQSAFDTDRAGGGHDRARRRKQGDV
jgi:hypothetical protein